QTFTRAFKKQFTQTPALYRRAEDWSASGICPPIRLGAFTLPQPEFVTLPEQHLIGLTQSYSCTLEQISNFRNELRAQFWRLYLGDAETLPPVLYGLHHSRPSQGKDDEQEVLYTTALEPHHVPANVQEGQPITLPGGEYAMFCYQGPSSGLQDFILMLYGTCLPALGLTRRKGHDIERFYPKGDRRPPQAPTEIKCDYLIPIRR
uniref:HTH araC/xylS-type domain-containing protein n=1 Tax=Anopheles maculatus TaxID=74869 RepID=A0A182SBB9_9DIPT